MVGWGNYFFCKHYVDRKTNERKSILPIETFPAIDTREPLVSVGNSTDQSEFEMSKATVSGCEVSDIKLLVFIAFKALGECACVSE